MAIGAVVASLIGVGAAQAADPPLGSMGTPAAASRPAARLTPPTRRVTLAFTGDTLLHSQVVRAFTLPGGGYDFSDAFREVAPILSSVDLAVCHLETPIAPPGEAITSFPRYGVPAQITTALAGAGYDRCSTASNHTMDRGVAGIDATVNALEAAGLSQTGMARTAAEAATRLITINGITIAHVAYTFGLNALQRPADQPWRASLIDVPTIVAAATDARAQGADAVIVSLHFGSEGSPTPDDYQRSVAAAVTASGQVDLIIGHHSHMVQPIERINGRWVVFSLGNFFSNMPANDRWTIATSDGMIAAITLEQTVDGQVTVDRPIAIPTWVDRGRGYVIRPVLTDLADPSLPADVRADLLQSLERTRLRVGDFFPA
jgi:poly-gamma-glutamate synthesis protein (capsule biosynthesis protein)